MSEEDVYRAKLVGMAASVSASLHLVNSLRSKRGSAVDRLLIAMNDCSSSVITSGASSDETRNALFRLVDVLEPGECPIGHSATDTLLSNGARLLAVAMARISGNLLVDEAEASTRVAALRSARNVVSSARNLSPQDQAQQKVEHTVTVQSEEGKTAEDAAQNSIGSPAVVQSTQVKRKRGRPRKNVITREDEIRVAEREEREKNEPSNESATSVEAKRKRGRPRTNPVNTATPAKRPRGRPRKHFTVKEEEIDAEAVREEQGQPSPECDPPVATVHLLETGAGEMEQNHKEEEEEGIDENEELEVNSLHLSLSEEDSDNDSLSSSLLSATANALFNSASAPEETGEEVEPPLLESVKVNRPLVRTRKQDTMEEEDVEVDVENIDEEQPSYAPIATLSTVFEQTSSVRDPGGQMVKEEESQGAFIVASKMEQNNEEEEEEGNGENEELDENSLDLTLPVECEGNNSSAGDEGEANENDVRALDIARILAVLAPSQREPEETGEEEEAAPHLEGAEAPPKNPPM